MDFIGPYGALAVVVLAICFLLWLIWPRLKPDKSNTFSSKEVITHDPVETDSSEENGFRGPGPFYCSAQQSDGSCFYNDCVNYSRCHR